MNNTLKTFILMAALTGLFMVGGQVLGGRQGMLLALVIALAMNFFAYWNSDKMALAMNRAREVSEAEAPELHQIVAGLARAFMRRGLKVRPFKPQNMSNNAGVTADGGEIGRAQVLQARACGITPSIHMNPVLLKPESETGAQVIVQGRRMANVRAREYGALKSRLQSCADRPMQRKLFSIGHRGAPLMFPEHTVESNRAAARMGAGILECDVTFTKDKALVCRHAQDDLHTTTNILKSPRCET